LAERFDIHYLKKVSISLEFKQVKRKIHRENPAEKKREKLKSRLML